MEISKQQTILYIPLFNDRVEIRVFFLGEEFSDCRFDESVSHNAVLDGIFSSQDCKIEVLLPREDNPSFVDLAPPKRKGRPKGQKNSNREERKSKGEGSEGKQKGHWLLLQNKKYHWFLEVNHQYFVFKEMRRLEKIFKIMSTYVGTREAEQCRSHHQKMEKKYHTFGHILEHLREQHYGTISPENLEADLRIQFDDYQSILSEEQLKTIESEKVTKKLEPISPVKTQLPQNPTVISFENILDDDYEHHLDFGFLF